MNARQVLKHSDGNGCLPAALFALAAFFCPHEAAGDLPYFRGLRSLPGDVQPLAATAISADGRVVVGYGNSPRGVEAFRWQVGGSTEPLGDLGGGVFRSEANAVSADGSVIVGVANYEPTTSAGEAFRWTADSGMVGLGFIQGTDSRNSCAFGISDDGVIVGTNFDVYGRSRAFRWTADGGMIGLAYLDPINDCEGGATAISADGTTIVGWSGCFGDAGIPPPPPPSLFRWTQPDGTQPLHGLPEENRGWLSSLTADGSVIVGEYAYGFWGTHIPVAFRWTSADGFEFVSGLGSQASAISADGTFIVGISSDGDWSSRVFLWDAIHGPRNLQSLVLAQGANQVADWVLYEPTGISADGRTLVGRGVNPAGEPEPWIAHLAWNGDVDADFDVDLNDLTYLLSSFALCAGDVGFRAAADLDESGCIELADLVILASHFGS